jgi:hypothetical protein
MGALTLRKSEPKHPGSLATDAELCKYWSDMDGHFGTSVESPLHHIARCEIHGWMWQS